MDFSLPLGTLELLKFSTKERIKEWQISRAELLQSVVLAEVKTGNLNAAQQDALFAAVIRLQQASLEGVSRNKLRLMAQVLNNTLSEPKSDKGCYLEKIVADMSEAEIFLVARMHWHTHEYKPTSEDEYHAKSKEKSGANTPYFRMKEDLVPASYDSSASLDAAFSRLTRTGLVLPQSGWDGIVYAISPLADELVKLCDMQSYNNPMNFEASAV